MQIPTRCGVREDMVWAVATLGALLLVLPLIPVVAVAGAMSEIARRVRE